MSRTFMKSGVLQIRPVNGADWRRRKGRHVVNFSLDCTFSTLSNLSYLFLGRVLEVPVP